jgi:peroxiredoxin
MRSSRFLAVLATAVALASSTGTAARVAEPAPGFTAMDSNGKQQSLGDFRGRIVVLEWHNLDCPFVKKHYGTDNMQALQREWTGKGVAWLTIISSAPGQQGHLTAEQANEHFAEQKGAQTAVLLDPEGTVGRLYEAKTTPHMFVIDPEGRLVYNGAIDDKPTADVADVLTAKNYLSAALSEAAAGKPVSSPTSRPYGCSVKYAEGTD